MACTDGSRQQRHCQGFIPRSEVCFFSRRRLLHFHGNPAEPGTDVENVCAAPESVDGTGLVCRCCRSLWQRCGVAILVVALCATVRRCLVSAGDCPQHRAAAWNGHRSRCRDRPHVFGDARRLRRHRRPSGWFSVAALAGRTDSRRRARRFRSRRIGDVERVARLADIRSTGHRYSTPTHEHARAIVVAQPGARAPADGRQRVVLYSRTGRCGGTARARARRLEHCRCRTGDYSGLSRICGCCVRGLLRPRRVG